MTGPPPRAAWWRRAAILAGLVALLVLLVSTDALHGQLMRAYGAAEQIMRRQPVAGAVVFVLLAAASAMLAFVSSAILVPAAIDVWGPLGCLLLLWSGWTLGGLTAWALARIMGRPVVVRLGAGDALARYERFVSGHAAFGFVLLFQLAMPSEIPGYVLGLARVRLARYLPALALAELPYAIGAVWIGASFLERRVLPLVLVAGVGIGFGVWAVRRLHGALDQSGDANRT